MIFAAISMKEVITELVPDGHIVLKLSDDGTGKGTALVVAVATKETTRVSNT